MIQRPTNRNSRKRLKSSIKPKWPSRSITNSFVFWTRRCGHLEQIPKEISKMAEAKWPVCQEESKANVHRPWPCDSDTADRPLRPGRLPSTSERIAWERAGAARGLWLCCVGRPSLGGKKGSHPFLGIGLPPRLAKDPSALPPFRKFISGFALAVRGRGIWFPGTGNRRSSTPNSVRRPSSAIN